MAHFSDLPYELILEIFSHAPLSPLQVVTLCKTGSKKLHKLTWDLLYWNQFLLTPLTSNELKTDLSNHPRVLFQKLMQLTDIERQQRAKVDEKTACMILKIPELYTRFQSSRSPMINLLNLVRPHERLVLYVLKFHSEQLIENSDFLILLVLRYSGQKQHLEAQRYLLKQPHFWEELVKLYGNSLSTNLVFDFKLNGELNFTEIENTLEQHRQLILTALEKKLNDHNALHVVTQQRMTN